MLFLESWSQDLKFKTFAGTTRYYGDLAPYSFINATSEAHLSLGVSVGVQINDFYSLNLRYLTAKISGNDALSTNPKIRARNLRFESPINEIGLINEININNLLWDGKSKYGIHFILSAGLNLYNFNPRTDLNGNIYFLQPLGTEGQGLSGKDENLYELTQWNVPYGLNIEFRINERFNMGIEVSSRYTFTDYLDDVSGNYPDYELLSESRGEIALALSNRMSELPGATNIAEPGDSRGDPSSNDWYLVTGIYFSYYFGPNPIAIQKKKIEESEDYNTLILTRK